jgi:L-seryl-tRNA(Ser) seleniumtransferase
MVKSGADLITFSGDKLLGGPQAGIIVGKRELVERIQKHPLARAVRIDKLTLAALEATLMEYLDAEQAREHIPTLRMLLEEPGTIKARAKKIASLIQRRIKDAQLQVVEDSSQAGGGSLPEVLFPTYVVAIKPEKISVNELEERLRRGAPAIVARIQGNSLILDARTIGDRETTVVAHAVTAALR